MNLEEVIVLGINGNCLEIAETIELLAQRGAALRVQGFLDDDPAVQGTNLIGHPVLGTIADAARFGEARFVNGIGSPRNFRHKPGIIARATVSDGRWVTIVHPVACISPRTSLGAGTVLMAHVVVGANARVGRHVIVLPNSVISHDAEVGDYTCIASGVCISGGCQIGANAYLGSNCTIRDGVRIGDGALIGMGAVVTRDVPPGATMAGNPAWRLKERAH